MRSLASVLALCLLLAPFAPAQVENPPAAPGVNVVFLPPPLPGTISLGIYDKGGKLVRTLRAEAAPEKDFTVGLNGLIAPWDGNDDDGRPAPAGLYRARGFCVGEINLSGEAIHGNDWVDEEAPRIASVVSLDGVKGEHLFITAKLVDGSSAKFASDRLGRLTKSEGPGASASPAEGRDGSVWTIEEGQVKQYSKAKELLRRLPPEPDGPTLQQLAASPTEEVIFLLEEKSGEQRLRGLALDDTAKGPDGQALSTWKMFLAKRIVYSPDFASIQRELKTAAPFKPEEKLTLRLVSNPLLNNAATGVEMQIGFNARGSFLRTADGLRLVDISDTPHLRWAVFGREGASKTVTIFQGDGAAVEQFRVRRPANMMAFDAGEYELKR